MYILIIYIYFTKKVKYYYEHHKYEQAYFFMSLPHTPIQRLLYPIIKSLCNYFY